MPNPAFPPTSRMPSPTAVGAAPNSFIARQPILDTQKNIFGYELLFRAGMENYFTGDSETATRNTIDTTLLMGIETLAPGVKAFVNCTREALTNRLVDFLPPESTVLEVLETTDVDDEAYRACVELKYRGYQIALDDYLPGGSCDRLLEMTDYVKLDFRACDPRQLAMIQRQLRKSRTALLAEKVETEEEFQRAANDGYEFFQGYFFARPTIIANHQIPSSRMIYIHLLSELSRDQPNREEISRLVTADAAISYRLLRIVNSAAFGSRVQISSITQALLMLGEDDFRKLVTVAAASCLGPGSGGSHELALMCLHRARFCELFAPLAHHQAGEQYLIGMLSVIDAMLQIPMDRIVGMLPMRPVAADVLNGKESPVDLPLRLIQHYECSEWEFCAAYCKQLGIGEGDLTRIYLESLHWATKQLSAAF